ncbi:NAD(P)/FAD-dependent oxidoreductase [Nonomuraea endophytica]|uniref:Glycine/D-amino acid oxidase-like deaminating enzyme n=1 Tax=Nonomuraea endophytica TaxID=714136 RepID=A0A7W8A9G8_9ACTN|nr:FAD-binding oxidoreductase [Nonomuraea endophytica]MBB5081499.1 glycine/D-amino acid oxidase-like deaminating enzyme [Nonomuraea endophytica]
MRSFDVGIVGAGVHGASAAFHLARRGAQVVVFERSVPAGGPTGRSSAVCRANYTNLFLAEVARDSLAMLADFTELTGRSSGLCRTGLMYLHPPGDEIQVKAAGPRLREIGVDVDVLEGEALSAALPGFELDEVAVAVWEPGGGYADPASTTEGLLAAAVRQGADLRLNTAVTTVRDRAAGVLVVSADGARTEVGRLLVAAGPWTRPLARQVGVDLPLAVERHAVASFRRAGAPPFPFGFADLPGGYYFKPDGAEQFQIASLASAANADPDDFAEDVFGHEVSGLAADLIRRVPALADAEPRGGWASLYDVSPDWQPVIGQISEHVYVDAGTSGHGFKLAPALGAHVAALLADDPVDDRLDQFRPGRFERGRRLDSGYGETRIMG